MAFSLPPVVGDPGGMRTLAAALRSTASTVGAVDAEVWGRASALDFWGPAASRLVDNMSAWHGTMTGAARELDETADLLLRTAAEVEQELANRARLERQRLEER